jgi:hypothetical protein
MVAISVVFVVMLDVFEFTVVANVAKSVTFAFNANPGTVGASAVPARSPANFILPFVVAFASEIVAEHPHKFSLLLRLDI